MRFNPQPVGASLHFTSRIPADAAEVLRERDGDLASFDLTPNWGVVPEVSVADLLEEGVSIPEHWQRDDVVVPIIHGQAFYIGDIQLGGGAMSASMKGVNLRTGRPEQEGPVSDDPSQTYWAPGVYLPWIDGYVPSDGEAVRQFVPLKGEAEMGFDVARHVGISDDDPFIDALRLRFFAPIINRVVDGPTRYSYTDGPTFLGSGSKPAMRGPVRGLLSASASSPVGMGAGARMRQTHQHNTNWKASDFKQSPWFEGTFRMVWWEDFNALANQVCGSVPVSHTQLERMDALQAEYEAKLRRSMGIVPRVATDVDRLPVAP